MLMFYAKYFAHHAADFDHIFKNRRSSDFVFMALNGGWSYFVLLMCCQETIITLTVYAAKRWWNNKQSTQAALALSLASSSPVQAARRYVLAFCQSVKSCVRRAKNHR